MKLHKGDEIKIVTGKDAGKTGTIEKVFTKTNAVLVPGINQFKRHMKARTQNQKSEIITITKPVTVANVALVCPKCKKLTRIGYTMNNKTKVRICRKCGKEI